MNEAATGLGVLLAISVVMAVAAHRWVRSFFWASVLAAMASSIAFQCAAYVQLGYLDPFFQIALVTGGAVALLAAVVTGVVMNHFNLRRG